MMMMKMKFFFRLALFGLPAIILINIGMSSAAALIVTNDQNVFTYNDTITAEKVKPPECAGIALDDPIVVGEDGTQGSNLIIGTSGTDTINGKGGNDCIVGVGGNDTLSGKQGKDVLIGGAGVDTLNGGNGDDTIYGNEGDDTLNGGKDNDTLYGNEGDDKLYGDNNNDAHDGGAGNDTCFDTKGTNSFTNCELP